MMAMQNMQAMHQKWMAAKTPAEHQALMADHMKAMQVGMSAMQDMENCCNAADSSKSMPMRMDMMTMMMQMMLDQQQGMEHIHHEKRHAPGSSAPKAP